MMMVRRPGWTLLLVALITGLATWSALSIRPDYDPRSFHPVGNSFVEATRASEAVFGTDDRNALVGVFAPAGGTVLSVDGFAHIHALTDALERLEGVESVMSVTTARTVMGTADTVDIAPLVTELPTTASDALALRDDLLSDETVAGSLISPDGSAALIRVTLLESWTPPKKRADLFDRLQSTVAGLTVTPFEALVGGFPMVRVQYSREMLSQVGRLLSMVTAVLFIVLVLVLRSLSGAVATLLVVIVANLWTHGVMGAFGHPFSILSMLTPIIVMVVGVADSIHVLTAFRRAEGDRIPRISEALRITVVPTLITSVTTAIGFAALVTAADVPMIPVYGLYTALGVVLAWAATCLVLPPILAFGLVSLKPAQVERRASVWMERRVATIIRRPFRTVIISAIVVGFAGVLASQVSTDANILDGLDPEHPIMTTYQRLESHFGGSLPLQVIYEGVDVSDPATLKHADDTLRKLESLEFVGVAQGPTALLRRFHQAIEGGGAEHAVIPDDAGIVSELLMVASFSDPNPLDAFISESDSMIRLNALTLERGAHATLAMQAELEQDLAARPLAGGQVRLGGTSYIAPRAWRILQERMMVGLGLGVCIITILFGFMFRSPAVALISIVPNLVPLVIVLAAMTLLGIPAKGNNAVVFSIAYGIAVDDTIHVLARLQHTAKRMAWPEAIAAAHRDVRGALTTTSLVLAAGFAVFFASSFEFTVTLGLQMVVTTGAALAADLFLLPGLLALVPPRKSLYCGPSSMT